MTSSRMYSDSAYATWNSGETGATQNSTTANRLCRRAQADPAHQKVEDQLPRRPPARNETSTAAAGHGSRVTNMTASTTPGKPGMNAQAFSLMCTPSLVGSDAG